MPHYIHMPCIKGDRISDTVQKIRELLKKGPALIAGTMGFDKRPQLHKAEVCFEEGAVFYFAAPKCGKYYGEIWPGTDVQPVERSILFETYDERGEYTGLARKRLGNARIDKPEDLTHWLSISEGGTE